MTWRLYSLVLGLGVLALLAGCGGGGPTLAPVTGTVTYQGKPIADAEVTFYPKAGRVAIGKTNAEGRFELMTASPGDGAGVGEYTVVISKAEMVSDPNAPDSPYKIPKPLLPPRYAAPTTSGLTAQVKAGQKNDFVFELKD